MAMHCYESAKDEADTPKVFNSLSEISNLDNSQDGSLPEIQSISDENELSPPNDKFKRIDAC